MVDYVKVATAGTTNLAATNAWTPTGVPASVTNDTATFNATSLGGSLSGNFTTRRLSFNGATAAVTHSGTITLGADGLQFGTSNTLNWSQSGTIAVGAINQTWSIFTGSGFVILSNVTANLGLTGTGNITIDNADPAAVTAQRIWFQGPNTAYTGTITLDNYVSFYMSNGASTGANFIVSGVNNAFIPAVTTGVVFGGAGKTLTINNDVELSLAGRSFTIAPNVVLAGTGTRTLTVAGNTDITGTVTGSNGVSVNVTDTTLAARLFVSGVSSGLSGPCVVSGNRLVFGQALTADRYAPSSLTINAGAEFGYNRATQDFNFPTTPTGSGCIAITGSFAGTGCTFPAGLLDSFAGRLVAFPAGTTGVDNLVKMVINQVAAGGLEWRSTVPTATTNTARFTYANAANVDGSFPLLLDTYSNITPATLLVSEYSLIVPSSSGTFKTSGTVTRQNSIGTTSARMSLTLGGSNTGDNTLSGDISEAGGTATLGITKADAGRWVLSGANSSHTGIHTISAGTLSAQSEKALGSATSAGGVTISGTGKLELSGGVTLNKSSTPFTIHASSPIVSIGDNTLQTAGITLGGTTTFEVTTGNRLAIVNSGAITDSVSTYGLTKTGDGELSLAAFANTYDGVVTVSAGTLAFGSSGSLGTGNVQVAGNLKYTGTGETYSRSTQLTSASPSLEASGTGALTVSNLSQNTATKTLTLKGTNTDANKITSNLADNTGILSLAKEGTGQWVLPSVLSYTGTTTVSGGTLRVETANSNTTSGAVTIGASGTVELITDTLASTSASAGEVLGTGNVTVNGGTIKTRGGVTQKGQVRYGGNLTFGTGSTLYIGAAA